MSERDGCEPPVPCWVGAMLSGGDHDGAAPPHWGVDQAVLADRPGAAFTVSRLVIASQGA